VTRRYDEREKNRFVNLLADMRPSGGNPWKFVGNMLALGVTQYFGAPALYAAERGGGTDGELWKLEREDAEDVAALQKRLLDTSWTLLRKYGLPDEYRIVQDDLAALGKAVAETESNPGQALRMFARLEPVFKMYAPFWYFYAAAETGDGKLKRLDEFDRVWRPVLRRDPFKAEAAKIRAAFLSNSGAPKEKIAAQLEIVMANSARENWVNNLFAGVTYYAAGELEKALACVSANADFGIESDISAAALADMRAGSLDAGLFADTVQSTVISSVRGYAQNYRDAEAERGLIAWLRGDAETAARLMGESLKSQPSDPLPRHVLAELIAASGAGKAASYAAALPDAKTLARARDEAARAAPAIAYGALMPIVRRYANEGSANARVFLGDMYAKGLGVGADIKQAAAMYAAPADAGNAYAQMMLGEILETAAEVKNEAKAAIYYARAAEAGMSEAAMRVGDMCRDGLGTGGKKPEDAYMWYCLALMEGEPEAQKRIDGLEGRGILLKLDKSVSAATASRARERARKIYEAIEGGGQ
jgi:TPR repeat protein